jgi:hypothetical protein
MRGSCSVRSHAAAELGEHREQPRCIAAADGLDRSHDPRARRRHGARDLQGKGGVQYDCIAVRSPVAALENRA